jgi:ABC-type antimicrobial peptide transport system permease subunit
MAVGAKGKDVLTQFMIEAIFISFPGCLMGIGFWALANHDNLLLDSFILHFFNSCWVVLRLVSGSQGSQFKSY